MALQGGLFNLAQTMSRPAQLSEGQMGLFDELGKALTPSANIDLSNPTSIRAAAEKEANAGNTVEAQRLLQIASQTEQRQQAERASNISRSYRQMEAAGRGREFEDAMIAAGRADELGAAKAAKMREDVLAMEYGDAKRSRQVRDLANGYFSANTNEGREAALTRMQEAGFGAEAATLRSDAAKARASALDAQAKQAKNEWDRAVREIKAMPVPSTEEGIVRAYSSVPPEYRGIYDQQVRAVLGNRMQLEKARATIQSNQPLDREFVESAGMDWDEYQSLYRTSGPKINETLINNRVDKLKTEASTLPTQGQYEQLNALFDTLNLVEENWIMPDEMMVDPAIREEVIQATWDKMRKDGLGAADAMNEAMIDASVNALAREALAE